MEIRPGSQGAAIPSSEANSYSTQRPSYSHNSAEFLSNPNPLGRSDSPQVLPSISGSNPNPSESSYYGGVLKMAPLSMEQTSTQRYSYENSSMESESYHRGSHSYNHALSDPANGSQDSRENYNSRDYSSYPKYPPVQREYLPYERERESNYDYYRHSKSEPSYPRPRNSIPEGTHHWNLADSSARSHDSLPQHYPPLSRNYHDGRNQPAGTMERRSSMNKRDEYYEPIQPRSSSFMEPERKIEVKAEDSTSEPYTKNSSPLALDKVVENCRMLSHFAFEYGNRSDRAYPHPSDNLVKEMAAKAQDILQVLTSLGAENAKMGSRAEALGDEDMEYIRNKRTLLAPSKPKYRKRSKRSGQPPPGRCHSCNTTETPEWRRGPDGARTLCNACGLHFAKLTRKRALVAAATANDENSENGDKELTRRSDGDYRKDNDSVKSTEA